MLSLRSLFLFTLPVRIVLMKWLRRAARCNRTYDRHCSDTASFLSHCPIAAKPPPNPNFVQQPMSSILKAGLQPAAPRPPALPPIRYAAAAAAAVSTPTTQGASSHSALQQPQPTSLPASNPPPLTPAVPPIGPAPSQTVSQQDSTSSPSLTHPSTTSPMLSSASVSHQPDGSFYSGQESPALSEAGPSSSGGPAATSSPQRVALREGVLGSYYFCYSRPPSADSVSSQRPGVQSPGGPVSPLSLPGLQSLSYPPREHYCPRLYSQSTEVRYPSRAAIKYLGSPHCRNKYSSMCPRFLVYQEVTRYSQLYHHRCSHSSLQVSRCPKRPRSIIIQQVLCHCSNPPRPLVPSGRLLQLRRSRYPSSVRRHQMHSQDLSRISSCRLKTSSRKVTLFSSFKFAT
jgi:hypothetical protein